MIIDDKMKLMLENPVVNRHEHIWGENAGFEKMNLPDLSLLRSITGIRLLPKCSMINKCTKATAYVKR